MANKSGKVETVTDFIPLGPKITVDSDCHHEIKRCLLLGRKTMVNLDSIFKNRNITWPTKVHIVKALGFPVVMYRCESWIIKKAECQIINPFKLWYWRRLFECPLDSKETKPVNPKWYQPWIFIGRTDAEASASILWPADVKSGFIGKTLMLGKIEGKKRRGQQKIWLDDIINSMDLSKLWEMVKEREAWCVAIHGVAKSQTWLKQLSTHAARPIHHHPSVLCKPLRRSRWATLHRWLLFKLV